MPTTELTSPELTVAVFSNGSEVIVVELGDQSPAKAIVEGFAYCGHIAVLADVLVPVVECEPGAEVAMFIGGALFAEIFGERLKNYQLAAKATAKLSKALQNR